MTKTKINILGILLLIGSICLGLWWYNTPQPQNNANIKKPEPGITATSSEREESLINFDRNYVNFQSTISKSEIPDEVKKPYMDKWIEINQFSTKDAPIEEIQEKAHWLERSKASLLEDWAQYKKLKTQKEAELQANLKKAEPVVQKPAPAPNRTTRVIEEQAPAPTPATSRREEPSPKKSVETKSEKIKSDPIKSEPKPTSTDGEKYIIVDKSDQTTYVIQNDVVIWARKNALGSAKEPTIAGRYSITYMAQNHYMDQWDLTVNYWMTFNGHAGIHDRPYRTDNNSTTLGCVSHATPDMAELYAMSFVGQKVVIRD